jgi:hypothetical protein
MLFDDNQFEYVLDTAANIYNAAYDIDYQEGVATVVAHLLLPDYDGHEQSVRLIMRALSAGAM